MPWSEWWTIIKQKFIDSEFHGTDRGTLRYIILNTYTKYRQKDVGGEFAVKFCKVAPLSKIGSAKLVMNGWTNGWSNMVNKCHKTEKSTVLDWFILLITIIII